MIIMIPEINEKEYERLFNEEMNKQKPWFLKRSICVNSFINRIFDENRFLFNIIFDDKFDILKNKRVINKIKEYFNDYYGVTLKNNVSYIDMPETISGIIIFSPIDWNNIKEFIDKIPDGWTVFIINPILMRYHKGSIGLFFTPEYCENYYIEECNDFIKSKTGYPLFLKYAKKYHVKEINYEKAELNIENFVKEVKKWSDDKGLNKLLEFWQNNDCVKVDSFKDSFNDYKNNLPFFMRYDIDFKNIESSIPFKLIHEENGEVLGPYNRFCLDKSFKVADVDNSVLELSDSQINDLLEGKYDFKLIE